MINNELDESIGLDSRIIELVSALNDIDAVTTISSCEGHADPLPEKGQLNTWFVSFEVARVSKGWDALYVLGKALSKYRDEFDSDATIILYNYEDIEDVVNFVLTGSDPSDLDTLSGWIRSYFE